MSKKAHSILPRFISVLALALVGGCGGSEAPTTCALDAHVSGAVEWHSGSENPACLAPFSGSSGISMYFKLLNGDVDTFLIEVRDVKAGQTGAFPAGVQIDLRDGRSWATATTACTVRIDEQIFELEDQFRKQYRASGTGECAAAAMPETGASGTLTAAPFSFHFPANF